MTMQPNIGAGSLIRHDKRTSAVIANECVLTPEAEKLLEETVLPAEFLARLIRDELWSDALQMLAHLLPQRFAVWWGCLCTWHSTSKDKMAETDRRALEAAGRWVLEPTEENRLAAAHLSTPDSLNGPCGCLAGAVEYTKATGPVRPEFVGHLVAAAVLNAAQESGEDSEPQFAALALRIGNSEIGWTTAGE